MGFAAAIPLIAAGIGAASSIHSTREQSFQAKQQRRMQQSALDKQESIQKKQEAVAADEKKRLQAEESDEIRRRRSKGRRSLLAGSEVGVDLLGQREDTL